MVSTDMLRDTTGFTSRYLGTTNVVKQARLTVVDVTHDGHHRRTRKSLSRIFFHHVAQNRFRIIGLGSDRMMSHFFNHDHRGVLIEHLVNRHHLPHLHERLNHFGGFNGHLMSKISHADRFRHAHITHHGFCVLNLLLLGLFMTAVIAVFTRTTPLFIAVIILIDNTGIALVAATMFNVIVPFARCTMVGTGVLAALFLAALVFIAITVVVLALFLIQILFTFGRLIALGLHDRGFGITHHFSNRTSFFFSLTLGFLTALNFFFRQSGRLSLLFYRTLNRLFRIRLELSLFIFASVIGLDGGFSLFLFMTHLRLLNLFLNFRLCSHFRLRRSRFLIGSRSSLRLLSCASGCGLCFSLSLSAGLFLSGFFLSQFFFLLTLSFKLFLTFFFFSLLLLHRCLGFF